MSVALQCADMRDTERVVGADVVEPVGGGTFAARPEPYTVAFAPFTVPAKAPRRRSSFFGGGSSGGSAKPAGFAGGAGTRTLRFRFSCGGAGGASGSALRARAKLAPFGGKEAAPGGAGKSCSR